MRAKSEPPDDGWDEITTQHGPLYLGAGPVESGTHRIASAGQTHPGQTHPGQARAGQVLGSPLSGPSFSGPGRAQQARTASVRPGTSRSGVRATFPSELAAERLLPGGFLSTIVCEYLEYALGADRPQALRAVREALESVGGLDRPLPQALAGHFVLSLANRLSSERQRSAFLAEAWEILAATGCQNTG